MPPPSSTPLSTSGLRSERSSPPFFALPPWQSRQCWTRTGRTFCLEQVEPLLHLLGVVGRHYSVRRRLGAKAPAPTTAKTRTVRPGEIRILMAGVSVPILMANSTSSGVVAKQIPAMADDGLLESVDEPASVRIIANDLLAGIPPRHHVIDGALELDSRSSWHLGSLEVRKLAVKRKTKNKGRHREAAPGGFGG